MKVLRKFKAPGATIRYIKHDIKREIVITPDDKEVEPIRFNLKRMEEFPAANSADLLRWIKTWRGKARLWPMMYCRMLLTPDIVITRHRNAMSIMVKRQITMFELYDALAAEGYQITTAQEHRLPVASNEIVQSPDGKFYCHAMCQHVDLTTEINNTAKGIDFIELMTQPNDRKVWLQQIKPER